MASNDGSFGFGAKVLIMLYGLGLALIGWYPIRQQYGGVGRFVSQHLTSLDKMKDSISLSNFRLDSGVSGVREKDKGEIAAFAFGASNQALDERSKRAQLGKEEHLDQITKKDKKQLESLINNLDK